MSAINKLLKMVSGSKYQRPKHKIVLLKGGKTPEKHLKAVGSDVFLNSSVVLLPRKSVLIPLGFKIQSADGYYVELVPRSSTLQKYNIHIATGIIDPDYRGEVMVSLVNLGKKSVELKKGDKVAQLITRKLYDVDFELVSDLDDTQRGLNGFGSSG